MSGLSESACRDAGPAAACDAVAPKRRSPCLAGHWRGQVQRLCYFPCLRPGQVDGCLDHVSHASVDDGRDNGAADHVAGHRRPQAGAGHDAGGRCRGLHDARLHICIQVLRGDDLPFENEEQAGRLIRRRGNEYAAMPQAWDFLDQLVRFPDGASLAKVIGARLVLAFGRIGAGQGAMLHPVADSDARDDRNPFLQDEGFADRGNGEVLLFWWVRASGKQNAGGKEQKCNWYFHGWLWSRGIRRRKSDPPDRFAGQAGELPRRSRLLCWPVRDLVHCGGHRDHGMQKSTLAPGRSGESQAFIGLQVGQAAVGVVAVDAAALGQAVGFGQGAVELLDGVFGNGRLRPTASICVWLQCRERRRG